MSTAGLNPDDFPHHNQPISNDNMTILVTGGRGKTALPLTRFLEAAGHPLLVCTRSPKADAEHPSVRFDWDDESTWSLPFEHPQAQKSPINAAYLVGRDAEDPSSIMIKFISFAKNRGVRRFVLLSAWDYSVPEVSMLRAHQYLEALEKSEGVEWAVLRPHFFMGMSRIAKPFHDKREGLTSI